MTPLAWTLELAVALLVVLLLVFRWTRPHVLVRRTGDHLELWLRRGWRATLQGGHALADPLRSRLAYTDGFFLFAPPAGARVVFIGVGAGIGPRQLLALVPDARITLVELSAAVLATAEAQFGLPPSGGCRAYPPVASLAAGRIPCVPPQSLAASQHPSSVLRAAAPRGAMLGPGTPYTLLASRIADGRDFLAGDVDLFDLIVLDAFDAGVFPARLCTVEAFELCRARLGPDGRLVVNLGGTLAGPLAAVWAALVQVFGAEQTRAFGVAEEDGAYHPARAGNTIAWAFRGTVPPVIEARPPFLPHLPAIAANPVVPPGAPPLRDAAITGDLEIR